MVAYVIKTLPYELNETTDRRPGALYYGKTCIVRFRPYVRVYLLNVYIYIYPPQVLLCIPRDALYAFFFVSFNGHRETVAYSVE